MAEVTQRYGTIARGFTDRLSGVDQDQWSSPTPCGDWNTAQLVTHVVEVHQRVVASLEGADPAGVDPQADLGPQWLVASQAVLAALADPAQASSSVKGMFGEQTFESLVGRLLCADTLVHTWDLARATGQDDALDPAGVAAATQFLAPLDEALRRPGGFAPKIEPESHADEQTRLLNFCGRVT